MTKLDFSASEEEQLIEIVQKHPEIFDLMKNIKTTFKWISQTPFENLIGMHYLCII